MIRAFLLRIGILTTIVLTSTLIACTQEQATNPDPNHTHADFAVWINNTQWDFSLPKYMSEAPKAETGSTTSIFIPVASAHDGHEEGDTPNPLRKYLHLHDGNGHVIHRHKPALTLGDFFTSLDWEMTNTCMITDTHETYCNDGGDKKWRMFVNNTEQIMNPHYVFNDADHILLTYGSPKEIIFTQLTALSDDACMYSKLCPERGDPPTENCIADPTVPCVAP